MPESDPIDFPNEADKKEALEEFHAAMRVRSTSEIGVTGGAR